MLETSNIDLAAYLKYRGLEPTKVTVGERGFRTFTFVEEPAKTYAAHFWDDDFVPVRAFAMARVAMKKWPATAQPGDASAGMAAGTTTEG